MFFCKDLLGHQNAANQDKPPEPCICCPQITNPAAASNEEEALAALPLVMPMPPMLEKLPEVTQVLPPELMVCYKTETKKGAKAAGRRVRDPRRKRAKSRELRGGILYTGCDCEKRNGLQDDCRRTGCQGSPECLTKPDPICGPSEFSNGKHLGLRSRYRNMVDLDENGNEKMTVNYKCIPVTLEAVKAL